MGKVISRGTVLYPYVGGGIYRNQNVFFARSGGYKTDLIGYHVYLGKNRWLLPNGRVKNGQTFHRRLLHEFSLGWWRIAC